MHMYVETCITILIQFPLYSRGSGTMVLFPIFVLRYLYILLNFYNCATTTHPSEDCSSKQKNKSDIPCDRKPIYKNRHQNRVGGSSIRLVSRTGTNIHLRTDAQFLFKIIPLNRVQEPAPTILLERCNNRSSRSGTIPVYRITALFPCSCCTLNHA